MLKISTNEFMPMLYDLRALRFTSFAEKLCKFYESVKENSDGTYAMPERIRLSALHCDIVSNKKVIDTEEVLFHNCGQANFLVFLPYEELIAVIEGIKTSKEIRISPYGVFTFSLDQADIVLTKKEIIEEEDPLFDIIRCTNRFIIKEKDKANSRTFYNIMLIREILVELWRYPELRVGQIIQPLLKDGEDLFYVESSKLYSRLTEGKQWDDFTQPL